MKLTPEAIAALEAAGIKPEAAVVKAAKYTPETRVLTLDPRKDARKRSAALRVIGWLCVPLDAQTTLADVDNALAVYRAAHPEKDAQYQAKRKAAQEAAKAAKAAQA
jgi:hypothetical protein